MVRCPNIDEDSGDPCGCDLQQKDRFCSWCGWKIDRAIFLSATCQAVLSDGTVCATALPKKCKFCPGCGTRVQSPKLDSSSITASSSFSATEYAPTDVSSSFTFNSNNSNDHASSEKSSVVPSSNIPAQISEICEIEETHIPQLTIDPSIVSTTDGASTSERKITTLQLRLSVPPVTLVPDKKEGQIKQVSAKELPFQRGSSVPGISSSEFPNSSCAGANSEQTKERKQSELNKQQDEKQQKDISPPGVTTEANASQSLKHDSSQASASSTNHSSHKLFSPHASPKRPPPGPVKVIHGLQQFANIDKSNTQRLSEAREKLHKFNKSAFNMRKSHSMDDLSTIDSMTESSIPCINVGDKKPKSVSPRKAKKSKGKVKKNPSKKLAASLDGANLDSHKGKTSEKQTTIAMETASAASDTDGDTTYLNEDTDHTSVDTVTEWTEASVNLPRDDDLPLDTEEVAPNQTSKHTEEPEPQIAESEVKGHLMPKLEGQEVVTATDKETNSNESSGQSGSGQDGGIGVHKEGSSVRDGGESEDESSGLQTKCKENTENNEQEETDSTSQKKKRNKEKKERKKKRGKSISISEDSTDKKENDSGVVTVAFHVLLSPEFHVNTREDKVVIRFNSPVLGGWEATKWPMQFVREFPEKFLLLRGEHKIPWYLLYNKTMEYKYVVTGPSRDAGGQYEFLYKKASGQAIINRELSIPNEKCRVDGKYHQYDAVIYPKPDENVVDKITRWLGLSHEQHKKLNHNTRRSMLALLPKWEGFVCVDGAESAAAWEMIQELEHVTSCLAPSFLTEKLEKDSSHIQPVLLEYLEPKINSFEKMKNIIEESSESASARIVSALAITMVIQKFNLPISSQHTSKLFEALLIRPDMKQKVCHEMRAVIGHFPVNRNLVIQALIDLCNKSFRLDQFQPRWLYAVPILHFLRGDSIAFTESDIAYNLNNERWWGIQALEHRTFRNNANIEGKLTNLASLIERLAPLFSVDVLLPRTIISIASLRHLQDIVRSRAFPMDVYCALLHVMVSAGVVTLPEKDRQIIADAMTDVSSHIRRVTDESIHTGSNVDASFQQMRVACEISVSLVELTLNKVTAIQFYGLVLSSLQVFVACLSSYGALINAMTSQNNKQQSLNHQSSQQAKMQVTVSAVLQWLKKYLPSSLTVTRSLTPSTATTEMACRQELQIWSQLFNVKFAEQSWEQSWKSSFLAYLQTRIDTMDDKRKIELFCQEDFSKCNKEVEECFSAAAFSAVETATFLFDKISGQIDDKVMKYGVMMSVLFESRWPKDVATLPDFKREQTLLRHMLMWTAFPRYLELFVGKPDVCGTLLSASCCQHLTLMVSLYERLVTSLLQGSIQLQTLRLIVEFSDSFLSLCRSLQSCKSRAKQAAEKDGGRRKPEEVVVMPDVDQICEMLECRKREIKSFETECQQVSQFLTMCSHIQPVQVENLKMKLAKDLTYHTLDDICEPITGGDLAVNPKVDAKVTYFSIKPELKRMFQVLSTVSQSVLFTQIWEEVAQKVHKEKQAELGAKYRGLTVEDIFIVTWLPVHSKWVELGREIEHGTITLAEVDKITESVDDNFDALTEEFRLFGMDQTKVESRIYQARQYRKLNQHFNGAHIFMAAKRAFQLTGNFQDIEALITAGDGSFKKRPLDCITNDLVRAGAAVSVLTEERAKCVAQLVKCMPLVQWLQTAIRNTRELKVFVDLASISAGEGDMSVDRVSYLHSSATGYAPLIYDLPKQADFHRLLQQCELVWKTLETDPALPDKLEGTFRHIDWFRSVKDTHGSVEMSTLSQVKAINMRGIFRVGCVKKDSPKTMERVISLTVPPARQDTDKMVFTYDQLNDLQSKLMLVAGKAEKSRQDVERFVEIFDGVKRLAESYIRVCISGNVLFNQWKVTLYCDPERSVNAVVDFGLLEQKKLKGQGAKNASDLSHQLRDLCEFMERCYGDWLTYISEKRDQFSHLNYFTTEQLVILRQELAKVGVQGNEPSKLVYPLLSVIKNDCTEDELYVAKETAFEDLLDMETLKVIDDMESEAKKKNSDVGNAEKQKKSDAELVEKFMTAMRNSDFSDRLALRALKECGAENIDDGIIWCMDHANDSDESEGDLPHSDDEDSPDNGGANSPVRGQNGGKSISKVQLTSTIGKVTAGLLTDLLQKEERDLRSQLETLWQQYLTSILTASLHDFLSVQHLGLVLQHLSSMATQPSPRPLPDYITPGQPNLILCPRAEALKMALALYMHGPDLPLPNPSEVLVCSEYTTDEEIELLWKRAASDRLGRIYCVLNADKLDYDVSVNAEKSLEKLIHIQTGYRIVIICSTEREDKCNLVTALDRYKVAPAQTPSLEDIQFYLHIQFQVQTRHHVKPAADLDPERSSVRVIQSVRSGLGKTLYKDRLNEKLQSHNVYKQRDAAQSFCISIPLQERKVNRSAVLMSLLRHTPCPRKNIARIFHLDIANEVQEGVDDLLFNLLILGQLTDREGYVWKRSIFDLYLIEVIPRYGAATSNAKSAKKTKQELLHHILPLLPVVTCHSPQDVLSILQEDHKPYNFSKFDPLMDPVEFHSPVFQRPFQYLQRAAANQNLDQFIYVANHVEGTHAECLDLLLRHCGVKDPSWAELRHFVWFLNVQLQDCEKSTFTDPEFVGDVLQGFFNFVVTFMVAMSKDFATRSLNMSEETPHLWSDDSSGDDWETDDEEELAAADEEAGIPELARFQLKRKWENSPHPYIFFNSDHQSLTFLGFNIDPETGDLIDPYTQDVLETEVMPTHLQQGLLLQRVRLHEHFDQLPRNRKIEKLCNVMGLRKPHDPDETYEITADNAKKILAIHMRFRCGIPVIIMGETGCGKTRLIRFMCALQAPPVNGKNVRNLEMMKVHGGTTARDIIRKVRKAEELARNNRVTDPRIDTVLFLDETNTTEAISLIKEIMCDRTMNGEPLDRDCGLKLIAACNPYRKHSDAMIRMLEQAGLGYHVRAEKTGDRMGHIPMRHLVYRVQPLPPSVLPLVWDFGQLGADIEEMYIRQIVLRYIDNDVLPDELGLVEVVSSVLAASQRFMREQKDECSFVSLRDVERCMNIMAWFYGHRRTLFLLMDQMVTRDRDRRNKFTGGDDSSDEDDDDDDNDDNDDDERMLDDVTRSLVLALGVCYHACLQDTPREIGQKDLNTRAKYRKAITPYFLDPCDLPGGQQRIRDEISRCQDVFLHEIQLGPNIARNQALKENVFMMVVCIELRIPLFLVGKPGSSKSLAKTIIADAMQGMAAPSRLFKSFKQVHMVSYQCSPLSTPDGIVGIFKQCAQFQQGKNLDQFVSCVVLDEVGLAEDSPRMPLKTLHPLLEDGCEGEEEAAPHKKVAFIGISNWALDPAKMNRGILVQRGVPDEQELVHSASGICMSGKVAKKWIEPLILPMSQAYLDLYNSALQIREFFGLRDFYSLVKMVFNFAKKAKRPPSWAELVHAIRRNFGGLDLIDPVRAFDKRIHMDKDAKPNQTDPDCSDAGLIRASLNAESDTDSESRYLLILTQNYSALPVLRQHLLHQDAIIIFGSSFPKDQEYTQVCRNINRIKICMETGRTVVLLNMESLYESLYDALNQYYVWFGGQRYVDLGLGTHRVKCRVHDDFRLVVVAEKKVVYEKFPIPLINRLEKHFLATHTVLSPRQLKVVDLLHKWADDFSTITMARHIETRDAKPLGKADAFIGYHDDTPASVVLQVWDVKVTDEENLTDEDLQQIVGHCKTVLLRCATPDAVARLGHSRLMMEAARLWDQYFNRHKQDTLASYLKGVLTDAAPEQHKQGFLAQVTTHSRLLAMRDMHDLSKALSMPRKNMILMALQALDTEQQFCRKVRDFFSGRTSDRLLIIQCDSGDVNSDLIACAKYCVEDEYTQSRANIKGKAHVVFLIQLPRLAGGCFLGFTGGRWQCAHIDELHATQSVVTSITRLKNRPISALLEEDIKGGEGKEPATEGAVNVALLLRGCVQAAVAMLNDEADEMGRITQRIQILLDLINTQALPDGSSFLQIVKRRICDLQRDKEDTVTGQNIANNWLCSEAASIRNIHTAGTLRRAVIQYLESRYTPLLAAVIAYTDHNRNLDLLVSSPDGHWIRSFWMDMLDKSDVTVLEYKILQSPKSRTELTRIPVTSSGYLGQAFVCQLPFSWVIKETIDNLIQTVSTLTGKDPQNSPFTELKRIEKQVNNLLLNGPMGGILGRVEKSGHQGELVHRYLLDFIHMTTLVTCEVECRLMYQSLEAGFREVTARSADQSDESSSLSLPSIHLVCDLIKQRLQLVTQILQLWPDAAQQLAKVQLPKSEMTLDVMSIYLVLEHLRPEKDQLNHSDQRADWLNSVAQYRPVIERVLFAASQNSELYGEISQTHLKACRYLWTRICAVQLFVEHVCPAGMRDEELGVKRCMPLWTYLGDEADFKTEISMRAVEKFLKACNATARKHYFGALQKCSACTETLQDPVALPCGHSCCHKCLLQLQSLAENECPDCQLPFSADLRPQPLQHCREATQHHQQYRRRCNAFFMELVSRLCFADGTPPEGGVINMLMNLIIGEARSKQKKRTLTRKMSVFDDCIDTTPVVRSFLLQLLLRSRMELVHEHLQNYFERVREMAEDTTQVVQLCVLCVQCMEDSFFSQASVSGHDNAQYAQVVLACDKLQNAARFDTMPALNIHVVETVAMTTFGLTVAAQMIYSIIRTNQETDTTVARQQVDENMMNRLFSVARRLCEQCSSAWPRLFLLKQLCRRYGQDCLERVTSHRQLQWIIPEDMLLNRQEEGIVDRFIVCGAIYREIRDAFARNKMDSINAIIQRERVTDESREVLILLALYREVTALHGSHQSITPTVQQTLNRAMDFIKGCRYIRQKQLAELLIENRQGGACPHLILQPDQSAFHRGVASLIVHTHLVLSALDRQKLAHPLLRLMLEPESMQHCYFPTMPQDELIDAREAALAARTDMENPVFYQCPNGHMYMIGNCGRPFYQGHCPVCRCRIGGNAYVLARGNAKANLEDDTKVGHCLGPANQRTRKMIGQRELTASATIVLRMLSHCAMILGATHDPKSVSRLIQPRIASADVFQFLWDHVTFDLDVMSEVLGRSQDDCMLTMHLLLLNMLSQHHMPRGVTRLDVSLRDKDSRHNWESLFSKAYISVLLTEGLDARLHEANHLIVNDDRLGTNNLMKQIFEVDTTAEEVDLNHIWEVPALWRYRARVTVEHLTQEVQENIASADQQEGAAPSLQLLNLFLQQEHILQVMHLLPSIIRLQWLLRQQFQHNLDQSEAAAMTVCEFLRDRAAQGVQKMEYEALINAFSQAWAAIKRLLVNPVGGGIRVPVEYCDLSVSDNTKISMLLPSRRGNGVCSLALVDFLIVCHNEFMEQYYRMKNRNFDTVSSVDLKDVTPAHLICIRRDLDLMPAILAHCSYSLEVGQGTVVHYDFSALQTQLDHQFFTARPFINRQVELMVYRDDSSNTTMFENIRQKIPQEALAVAVQRQIQSELRLQSDVHDALSLIYVVMSFSTSVKADPETRLADFVKSTLSMQLKIASQKVKQMCQMKHLLSLWLLLSVEKAKQLTNNQQDAFENIPEDYHEDLSDDQRDNLRTSLRHMDANTLLSELYECIVFRISQSDDGNTADEPNDTTGFRLRDTLMAYTFEKDGPDISGLDSLPEDILNKHAIDAWKIVLQFCQKMMRR